jgi:hypothetical protein
MAVRAHLGGQNWLLIKFRDLFILENGRYGNVPFLSKTDGSLVPVGPFAKKRLIDLY